MSSIENEWNEIIDQIEKSDLFPDVDMDIMKDDMFFNDIYYRIIFKHDKELAIKALDLLFHQIIEGDQYYHFLEYVEFMENEEYSNNKEKAIEVALSCFELAKSEEDCDFMRDVIDYLNNNSVDSSILLTEAKKVCPDDEYEWE